MLPKPLSWYLFLVSICLSSCEFHCSVGEDEKKGEPKEINKPVQKEGALLYNGIHLVTRGIQVDKAYLLTNEDDPERIEEDNFIDVKRGVRLAMLIKDGWKPVRERVRLGASMRAVADDGTVIVERPELFKEYDETGISIADSKMIALSLYLTTWKSSRPVSITVTFKVWDKQSDAFVEGEYTIHTK